MRAQHRTIPALLLIIAFCCATTAAAQDLLWTKLDANGAARCLNLAVGADGSVIAGTNMGVYRSVDDGATWQYCGLDSFSISGAAVDSLGRMYAAGGKESGGRRGIFRSDDGGKNWTTCILLIDSLHANVYASVTALLAVTNEVIVAATDGLGFYRSTDHGATWAKIFPSALDKSIASVCRATDGSLYAGTYGTIYRSTNNGATWLAKYYVNFPHLLTPGRSADVFVVAMGNDGINSVYRSTNFGLTWLLYGLRGKSVAGIAQEPHGTVFAALYGDTAAALRTVPASTDWTSLSTDILFRNATSIVITPGGYCLVGLWDTGVFRSSGAVSGVRPPADVLPERPALAQNHPNPFNPSTVIRYRIPVRGAVTLTVFDLLGREQAVLVDERQEAGEHEAVFDARRATSTAASGVYLCRLRAGNDVRWMRMVLVK